MPQRPGFDLAGRFRAASREMRARYESASLVGRHGGDKGLRREDALRGFLREVLPPKYGVGRGEVVSALGDISKQMDIVIYDALHAPMIFTSATSRIFPAESVYATIEVKSRLTVATLDSCIENILSVKRLPRNACTDHVDGHAVDSLPGAEPEIESPPPFCGVFAFEAMDLRRKIFPALVWRNRGIPRSYWMGFLPHRPSIGGRP